jgi:hypothetical protein
LCGGLLESGGRSSCGDVAADALDCVEGFLERLFGGGVDGGHLTLDVEAVGREVVGYVEKLAGDYVADAEDADESHNAGQCDGQDAWDATALEAADGRGQHERESEREGEGDEEISREVEDKDDDCEQKHGLIPGYFGGADAGH